MMQKKMTLMGFLARIVQIGIGNKFKRGRHSREAV
jgi:hypothetical protein